MRKYIKLNPACFTYIRLTMKSTLNSNPRTESNIQRSQATKCAPKAKAKGKAF